MGFALLRFSAVPLVILLFSNLRQSSIVCRRVVRRGVVVSSPSARAKREVEARPVPARRLALCARVLPS